MTGDKVLGEAQWKRAICAGDDAVCKFYLL